MKPKLKVSWISAGVSSFISTYLAKNVDEIIYIDIDDQHPDSMRFIKDCEKVLEKPIQILKSPLGSVEKAQLQAGLIRMSTGYTPCTNLLKKRVRKEWENAHNNLDITYVWGFDVNEKQRACNLEEAMPQFKHEFPLIERELTKQEVHALCEKLGIKRPAMYDMGYSNNNCIGCVRGGMGYWNKIRVDFPKVFERRAEMERKLNSRCLKECYLDELDPKRGRMAEEIMPDCNIFCQFKTDI
jgi:hypothetical protein